MSDLEESVSSQKLWVELKRTNNAKTTRELARKLGIGPGDDERNFYRWVSAKRGSHESTVFALDALGFITQQGRAFLGLPALRPGHEAQVVADAEAATGRARAETEAKRPPRRGAA